MNVDKIEAIFFNVLADLKEYLPYLTLVGGWLPYIYSKFLWGTRPINLVTTVDIDFGVGDQLVPPLSKTIFQTLAALNYKERHVQMDRNFPVVLHKGKIPVEFITSPNVSPARIEKLIGRQIQVSRLDKFDFLLKHHIEIPVGEKKENTFLVKCPKPSAFLYHKGVTFVDREDKNKQAKDLHYIYFILRYAPNIEEVFAEVRRYRKNKELNGFADNLKKCFERISSPGCLLVEQENGPDEYIYDLRQDIFERFNRLLG